GGGGLVPATLALVADMYPASRRGVPLGVVGAVQELGSVLGPLYGALVLALADWQAIFWLNLAVGLVLAAALGSTARSPVADPPGPGGSGRTSADPAGPHSSGRPAEPPRGRRSGPDLVGAVLALLSVALLTLVLLQPERLTTGVTVGLVFLPVAGDSRWLSPVALALYLMLLLLVVRSLAAARPLVPLRSWAEVARRADLVGAALLALSLAGIILAFATADPQIQVFSPAGPWFLGVSAVTAVLFWARNSRVDEPLVPQGAFAATPARGALLVSFFVGAALIAALVDIPIFARVTAYPDSQLMAALVLLRLLVALPVGALLGGHLVRRLATGVVTACGMALAAVAFAWMSTWGLETLSDPVATVPLVMAGLGFGLALAPVNAALLAATADAVHGVASAFLVVARMVGMLVGISALTTIGLRRYYAVQVDLPSPTEVCGASTRCAEYTNLLKEAGLEQLQTVFVGAAFCALAAAVLAAVTFRSLRPADDHARTRTAR
ncbi:MAG TPA: MFS transporter, partial [Pedococcus sp.]|nr:MFS transporter [Pedococcus sp.]